MTSNEHLTNLLDGRSLRRPSPTPRESLHEFFLKSPLRGADLNLERMEDYPRAVEPA